MESPFYPSSNTAFCLYLEPFLNTHFSEYTNIITVSCMPDGPLRSMVKQIRPAKLSPFIERSVFDDDSCMHVLTRYPSANYSAKMANAFLFERDIPAVLQYLVRHGYRIDTDVSTLLLKGRLQKKKMIAMVSM